MTPHIRHVRNDAYTEENVKAKTIQEYIQYRFIKIDHKKYCCHMLNTVGSFTNTLD